MEDFDNSIKYIVRCRGEVQEKSEHPCMQRMWWGKFVRARGFLTKATEGRLWVLTGVQAHKLAWGRQPNPHIDLTDTQDHNRRLSPCLPQNICNNVLLFIAWIAQSRVTSNHSLPIMNFWWMETVSYKYICFTFGKPSGYHSLRNVQISSTLIVCTHQLSTSGTTLGYSDFAPFPYPELVNTPSWKSMTCAFSTTEAATFLNSWCTGSWLT